MSVIIGSKYVGKAESRNVQTGEFWSVMPEFSDHDRNLQASLLPCIEDKAPSKSKWKFWK